MENFWIVVIGCACGLVVMGFGIAYLFMGSCEYIMGKPYKPASVQPMQSKVTEDSVKRLEELATLERNDRLASEKK